MILVDTSVWIDHLRTGDDGLVKLLNGAQVSIHPFVIGELACGNLRDREKVLALLSDLPRSAMATGDEVLHFIEQNHLMGRGIGYVDAHLLAAVTLDGTSRLWTRDKQLEKVSRSMGLDWNTF